MAPKKPASRTVAIAVGAVLIPPAHDLVDLATAPPGPSDGPAMHPMELGELKHIETEAAVLLQAAPQGAEQSPPPVAAPPPIRGFVNDQAAHWPGDEWWAWRRASSVEPRNEALFSLLRNGAAETPTWRDQADHE